MSAVALTLLAGCSAAGGGELVSDEQADLEALARIPDVHHRDLCATAAPGQMRCHAKIVTGPNGELVPNATPKGLGPSDLRSAYKLPASGGNGKIVAIIDAYDAPSAESDLAKYRAQYGISPCTTANGCFQKVNQNGQAGNYPQANSGWAGEIALDIDMVSAACPDCKILLVEADSASTDDLGTAVNTAAQMGAAAISNSYGGPEDSSISSVSAQYYKHPGILITVSSGDNGYGTQYPASAPNVLAVGGTALAPSGSSRGWAETAWTSGGSGCSKYITKPAWQADTKCTKRTVADVAAVGDPRTGVAVYDGGWQVVGGTSASSPIIAAIYTLLGIETNDGSYSYSHASSFFDITSGSNGSCGGSYLCSAAAGYDGPTGIGSPNGSLLSGGTVVPDAGPVDSGVKDSGVGPVDSGHGGQDSGGVKDSGTPVVDAGADSGEVTDSGVTPPPDDAGSPAHDGGGTKPGKDAGGKDAGNGDGDPPIDPPSAPSGCGCAVPGTSTPLGGAGSSALLLGAMAIFALRRRRAIEAR